ncbi:MBL fold metallo-hydrolase [Oceanicella sp. SM1341]|uniref:MBL fold metallo-hydrolase n=1 Tax=Oceanicella sp. SM1341 TaxID=1548889 RepID=UPI000E4D4603|nr:MBL fold metallo-hydrolase [Oceanicella sp. SM1341]
MSQESAGTSGQSKPGPVRLRVWGCRGSLPVPDPAMRRYGGDTTCFELVGPEGKGLVIDCGSGLRGLGQSMLSAPKARTDILLSHSHFDHLIGLGFFMPLVTGQSEVTIWTGQEPGTVREALERLYGPPLWPIRIPDKYRLPLCQLEPRSEIGGARVQTFPLNHPGGCTGFRIELGGRVIVSVTDHEHGVPEIDAQVIAMARGADLMLYDAAYSNAEYPLRRGWGHSTWEVGLKVAEAAAVKQTLLVHHSPHSTDEMLDAAALALAAAPVRWQFARDGMELEL